MVKTTIQSNTKYQEFSKESFRVGVLLQPFVKPLFFVVYSNLTYDSEAFDVMKLYLGISHQSPVEKLRWSIFIAQRRTQKQRDKILNSPRVLSSLSNTRNENITN